MSDSKRQKQREIEYTDDMIDYISNMPDCILHHILSSLSTVEVVQTSILSRRWKNLWASVPSLDVDEKFWYAHSVCFQYPPELIDESMASFENFEERILRSRDAPKIEKIMLECHQFFDSSLISSWICNGIMKSVRDLHLYLYHNDPTAISQATFDCKSLVTLELLIVRLVIPSRIYLPCLKTLHLIWAIFPDKESTEKLFSSCPILEELVLSGCSYGNFMNITISSLTLKKLTIKDQGYCNPSCKIKIDAKNLTYLDYDGKLTNEILLDNIPSLVKACIDIRLVDSRQDEVTYDAVDLLKVLQKVEFLSVSNHTLESLILADMMNPFPVFPNLTRLVLSTEIGNHTFRTLMYLLNFCPTLQSISFSKGFKSCLLLGENDSIWLSTPICMIFHLKNLTFKNFDANDSEIWFLKYVLKYACVLEKMNVSWCKPESPDFKKQRDVRRDFEITEKSSSTCIITFS